MEDTSMQQPDDPVFHELTFTIVPSSITPDRVNKLAQDITASGGTVVPFDFSPGSTHKLEDVVYIVSATTDFHEYYRTLDLMINVVKPQFVDDCLSSGKMKNPRSYSPDPALFMSNVVVCCGDIPEGDQDAIAGGVIAMGGQYTSGLSKATTHLVALSMDEKRCKIAVDKRLPLKIVLPHWFDDCLRVGRRLDERPYLLPDPEILNIKGAAIASTRDPAAIREASNPEPKDEPVSSTPPAHLQRPRVLKAFAGKKVKLGADLNLNPRLKGTIAELIEAGDGLVTTDIDEADIYVCNYRDGEDYVKASQANKGVGNLGWLYYLITHDEWTNPMRRMLHYPRPRHGIPGFEKYKISISSYTGEARVFLENLIKATGAEFTRTFKQDNTHLIAAHKASEKYDAAQEWNVNVVNNLWLEECYARCKNLPLTDPRYTYFPPRTNMGETLGATEMDRDAVKKMFLSNSRRPQAPNPVPASSVALSRGNSDRVARTSPLAKKTTGRRTKSGGDAETPITSRRFGDKENETPGTTGSRGAKDRAMSKLHASAEDIANYEKEMKRKGGVIHGGPRRKEDETSSKPKRKGRDPSLSKRSIDEVDVDDGTTEEDEATKPGKKPNKRARKGPIKYRMLVSKLDRWQDKPDLETKEKARLRELGIFVTEDCKNVDLVLAPKMVRTPKVVSAFACGPALVSPEFLVAALEQNKVPRPENFPLDTAEWEEKYNIDLDEALVRAQQNKHRLLKDWQIFCTSAVPIEKLRTIIENNGGACLTWRGVKSAKLTAHKRKIETQPDEVSQNLAEDEGDVLYLISDAKKNEVSLWKPFRDLAEKHDMIPRIVTVEWLLNVAIAQRMMWSEEWEIKKEDVA